MTDKIMPKHVAYHRDLFMGSARVNRRLDWLQRHIYLRLCLEACFCEPPKTFDDYQYRL